jgi:hypothetical protein
MRFAAVTARSRVHILRIAAIESLWLLGALGLALMVTTYLAGSAGRGELMFLDGDSMIVPMFSRSILEGTANDWAMSAVLFVPETIVFLGLSLTGLGVQEVQFLAAVLNFAGLYLVFRAAAVTAIKGNRAALAATAGFVAVCLLALTEGGGDGDSLQLASLPAMTTYYAATALGALLTVGITRRIVGNASPQLIQTDFALRDYAWLVDRADFAQPVVSFLIVDEQSAPFTLPPAAEDLPSTTIDCGRFQILDYSPASITRP